jgi:hypothetical protein
MSNYEDFNPIQFDDDRSVRSKIAFSVSGTIEITPYGESSKRVERTNIVYAIDMEDAERKFTEHYQNKNRDYEVYYTVYNVDVSETII